MIFSFGQIEIQIHDQNNLTELLQKDWGKYLQKSNNVQFDLSLDVESVESFGNKRFSETWNIRNCSGENIVVYSDGKKPLFGLQYQPEQNQMKVYIQDNRSNSVRMALLYGILTAMHHEFIGLHGVTLLCAKEIIILSAASGIGKTTLSKLLEEYCDAIVVNGDFALLYPNDDGVIFEPTPFCGTSRRCLNQRLPVSRIVFLGQAKENQWRKLDGREAVIRFMSNAFVPTWDNVMQQTVQDSILKCISLVKVNEYNFAPTQAAAEEFLKQVEKDSSL